MSDILRSLRLRGGLVCRARLRSPWAIHTDRTSHAMFHGVVTGECWVTSDGDPPERLGPGDLVLFPHGASHELRSDPATPARDVRSLRISDGGGCVGALEHGDDGELCVNLCGRFSMDHGAPETLLDLLPSRLIVRRSGTVGWLDGTLEQLGRELDDSLPGSETIVDRLADILVVQILREWSRSLPEGEGGWLGGARDRHVGDALSLIHQQPGHPWTASNLAKRVGLSRTLLYERFTQLVGQPPLAYLTRWRMRTASDLMRRPSLSLAQIAERVGYASEDAFRKAFQRETGHTPAQFRRALPA